MNYLRRGILLGLGLSIGLFAGALTAITVTGRFHEFAGGEVVYASRINDNFTALKNAVEGVHEVPVGAIVAWHPNLFSGSPSLPPGWVSCDGQVLTDGDSPLNGRTIPDLNGQTRFLRGGATSGVNQADSYRAHSHTFTAADPGAGGDGFPAKGYCGFQITDRVHVCGGGIGNLTTQGGLIHNSGGAETRPMNMSVRWIMKVK